MILRNGSLPLDVILGLAQRYWRESKSGSRLERMLRSSCGFTVLQVRANPLSHRPWQRHARNAVSSLRVSFSLDPAQVAMLLNTFSPPSPFKYLGLSLTNARSSGIYYGMTRILSIASLALSIFSSRCSVASPSPVYSLVIQRPFHHLSSSLSTVSTSVGATTINQ